MTECAALVRVEVKACASVGRASSECTASRGEMRGSSSSVRSVEVRVRDSDGSVDEDRVSDAMLSSRGCDGGICSCCGGSAGCALRATGGEQWAGTTTSSLSS